MEFITYPYHHKVVLDKYTHSNLVYYKHNGDDEPYDLFGSSADRDFANKLYRVKMQSMICTYLHTGSYA